MKRDTGERPPWGNGLVLFRPGRSRRARRRRLAFVSVVLALAALLVWPLAARVPPIEPKILGLPFGIAWVVGALLVMLVAVALLFRGDLRDGEH